MKLGSYIKFINEPHIYKVIHIFDSKTHHYQYRLLKIDIIPSVVLWDGSGEFEVADA